MALDVTTIAPTGITSDGATLRGEWTEPNTICCESPCCTINRRFYYGLSSPPTTLVSSGGDCNDTPSYCPNDHAYSYGLSGLLGDETYYVLANCAYSGCGSGGACTGQDNGSILSFRTCGDNMGFSNIGNNAPGEDSCVVFITFNPSCNESVASLKVQYKEDSSGVWLDGTTKSNLKTSAVQSFTLTGLTPATLYDFRFVASRPGVSCGETSRTSVEGAFTTAASSIDSAQAETVTAVDAVTLEITGQATVGEEELLLTEDASLLITAADRQEIGGIWFYHLPTRSYWFYSIPNVTAALADTDSDDKARTFVASGSDVFILDDPEYPFDDLNQSRPLDDAIGSAIPLSIAKALDGQGAQLIPAALDVKWGSSDEVDPVGKVDLDFVTDLYPGGPKGRRQLATRRVDIAADRSGYDEWRAYAVPRMRPAQTMSLRFHFPSDPDTVPKRRNPIEIEAIRLHLGKAPLRRRRS